MRLDASRALVLDILFFARNVPQFPVERTMNLGHLARCRTRAEMRISWCVLFCKAYAMVANEFPELRRCYLRWPWPHLFQHDASTATIAINRRQNGQDRLFLGQLWQPESTSLAGLQSRLSQLQQQPLEEVFSRQVRFSRFPTWLRRLIWWWRIHLSPHRRARRLGTFGLSVLAGEGAFNRHHLHFLTTSVTYGPLEESGKMLVTLLCDHRVLDGMTAARALNQLESVLQGPITRELCALGSSEHSDRSTIIRRPEAYRPATSPSSSVCCRPSRLN